MSTVRAHIEDFRDGISHPLTRLRIVTEELIAKYRELAELQAAERQQKLAAYADNDETTVTGREKFSEYATLNLSSEIIKLKAEILAYQEERDFLRLFLEESNDNSFHSANESTGASG